tara:strand:- start:8451 stop:10262 length:1812 start_codon:yes stop_codon:yes gene_type:complete
MITLIRQNKEEVLLISALLFCILSPKFGAIDNVSIRWFFLSFSCLIYLIIVKPKSFFYESYSLIIFSIFLFSGICSIPYSINFSESLISISKYFVIVSVFLIVFNSIKKLKNPDLIISYLFIISLIIESLYTNVSFLLFGFEELKGISMNRNISTFSLVFKLPFLLYLISKTNNGKSILLNILEILVVISVILLQSRGGILSLLFIYTFLLFFKKRRKLILTVTKILLILFGTIYMLPKISSAFNVKLQDSFSLINDESFNQRLEYYKNALDLFLEKPFFGNGIGSFKTESLKYYDEISTIPYYAHNDFLQILSETGILGLLSYILIFIFLFKILFRFKKSNPIFPFLIISITIYLFNSLINFPINRPQEVIPFVILASLITYYKETSLKSNSLTSLFMITVLFISLIFSSFLSYKKHKSLVLEDKLISYYFKNEKFLELDNIDKIDYRLPNLSSNTTPISTYLAKINIDNGDYQTAKDLLDYSTKINPYIEITWKEKLTLFLKTQMFDEALVSAQYLFNRNPNDELYAEIYFSVASSLNNEEIFNSTSALSKSTNINVHYIFYNEYLKLTSPNKSFFIKNILESLNQFPNDNNLIDMINKTN